MTKERLRGQKRKETKRQQQEIERQAGRLAVLVRLAIQEGEWEVDGHDGEKRIGQETGPVILQFTCEWLVKTDLYLALIHKDGFLRALDKAAGYVYDSKARDSLLGAELGAVEEGKRIDFLFGKLVFPDGDLLTLLTEDERKRTTNF